MTAIEKAARALAALAYVQPAHGEKFEIFFWHMRSQYEREARAVIEALNEPSRAMWAAGADACVTKINVHHDKVVGDVWGAMLGAVDAV